MQNLIDYFPLLMQGLRLTLLLAVSTVAVGLELDIIAACVIGGISIAGRLASAASAPSSELRAPSSELRQK